jgi:hypothetical protein
MYGFMAHATASNTVTCTYSFPSGVGGYIAAVFQP